MWHRPTEAAQLAQHELDDIAVRAHEEVADGVEHKIKRIVAATFEEPARRLDPHGSLGRERGERRRAAHGRTREELFDLDVGEDVEQAVRLGEPDPGQGAALVLAGPALAGDRTGVAHEHDHETKKL